MSIGIPECNFPYSMYFIRLRSCRPSTLTSGSVVEVTLWVWGISLTVLLLPAILSVVNSNLL